MVQGKQQSAVFKHAKELWFYKYLGKENDMLVLAVASGKGSAYISPCLAYEELVHIIFLQCVIYVCTSILLHAYRKHAQEYNYHWDRNSTLFFLAQVPFHNYYFGIIYDGTLSYYTYFHSQLYSHNKRET